MVRTFIGGIVGGLILFVSGFIFWATPLGEIPFDHASDAQNAAVQLSLNQNLTAAGTGAYHIPDPRSREGANQYTQGPIATVFFNTQGFSPQDMSMLLPGAIMALIAGLLLSFALAAVGGGRSFAGTARLVVLMSLAFTVWEFLASPIFNHFGWRFWIYSFVAESVGWIVAGLVIARWFLPIAQSAVAIESSTDAATLSTSVDSTAIAPATTPPAPTTPPAGHISSNRPRREGIIRMALGATLAAILYIFIYIPWPGCYAIGQGSSGQPFCIRPQLVQGAWVLAAALILWGAWGYYQSREKEPK